MSRPRNDTPRRPVTSADILRQGYAPLYGVVVHAVIVCGCKSADDVMKVIRRMESNPVAVSAFEQIAAEYFAPRH